MPKINHLKNTGQIEFSALHNLSCLKILTLLSFASNFLSDDATEYSRGSEEAPSDTDHWGVLAAAVARAATHAEAEAANSTASTTLATARFALLLLLLLLLRSRDSSSDATNDVCAPHGHLAGSSAAFPSTRAIRHVTRPHPRQRHCAGT